MHSGIIMDYSDTCRLLFDPTIVLLKPLHDSLRFQIRSIGKHVLLISGWRAAYT